MTKKIVSPVTVPAGFKTIANKFVKAVSGHTDALAAFEATKQTATGLALECFAVAGTDKTKLVWALFKASKAVPHDAVTQDPDGNKHAVYKALLNAKQLYDVGASDTFMIGLLLQRMHIWPGTLANLYETGPIASEESSRAAGSYQP